jgi:hypothetical protein
MLQYYDRAAYHEDMKARKLKFALLKKVKAKRAKEAGLSK